MPRPDIKACAQHRIFKLALCEFAKRHGGAERGSPTVKRCCLPVVACAQGSAARLGIADPSRSKLWHFNVNQRHIWTTRGTDLGQGLTGCARNFAQHSHRTILFRLEHPCDRCAKR